MDILEKFKEMLKKRQETLNPNGQDGSKNIDEYNKKVKRSKYALPQREEKQAAMGVRGNILSDLSDYTYLKDMKYNADKAKYLNERAIGPEVGKGKGLGSALAGLGELGLSGALKGAGALVGLLYPSDTVSDEEEMENLNKAKLKALSKLRNKEDK